VELSGLDYDDLKLSPNFILEVGESLRARMQAENIVITRGKEGMSLISSGEAVHMPTFARAVFDVTGAGDTVIAALAMAHVAGFTLPDALSTSLCTIVAINCFSSSIWSLVIAKSIAGYNQKVCYIYCNDRFTKIRRQF
jgi:bifunctional ADP-heptose synthase (sugar kinase/adenylyltransferase)